MTDTPIPTTFPMRELLEEIQTILSEKERFVADRVAAHKISPEFARLEQYRFARLRQIAKILQPLVDEQRAAKAGRTVTANVADVPLDEGRWLMKIAEVARELRRMGKPFHLDAVRTFIPTDAQHLVDSLLPPAAPPIEPQKLTPAVEEPQEMTWED